MATAYTWRTTTVPATSIPAPEIRSNDSITSPSGSGLATSGTAGFCLHDADGGFHAVDSDGGDVRYSYTSLPAPPYQRQVFVEPGSRARMAIFSTTQRVALDWYDGSDVVVAYSDDHGETWSASVSLFTGATRTMPIATDVGSVIHTAVVSGEIQAIEELMDGSWTADSPWTFVDSTSTPLAIDDADYGISRATENPARYILLAVSGGDGSAWESFDDCRTWSPI